LSVAHPCSWFLRQTTSNEIYIIYSDMSSRRVTLSGSNYQLEFLTYSSDNDISDLPSITLISRHLEYGCLSVSLHMVGFQLGGSASHVIPEMILNISALTMIATENWIKIVEYGVCILTKVRVIQVPCGYPAQCQGYAGTLRVSCPVSGVYRYPAGILPSVRGIQVPCGYPAQCQG